MMKIISLLATIFAFTKASEFDYICNEKGNGYLLPHPHHCNSFVECFNNIAFVKECGNSLHFNQETRRCDYPSKAKCEEGYGGKSVPNSKKLADTGTFSNDKGPPSSTSTSSPSSSLHDINLPIHSSKQDIERDKKEIIEQTASKHPPSHSMSKTDGLGTLLAEKLKLQLGEPSGDLAQPSLYKSGGLFTHLAENKHTYDSPSTNLAENKPSSTYENYILKRSLPVDLPSPLADSKIQFNSENLMDNEGVLNDITQPDDKVKTVKNVNETHSELNNEKSNDLHHFTFNIVKRILKRENKNDDQRSSLMKDSLLDHLYYSDKAKSPYDLLRLKRKNIHEQNLMFADNSEESRKAQNIEEIENHDGALNHLRFLQDSTKRQLLIPLHDPQSTELPEEEYPEAISFLSMLKEKDVDTPANIQSNPFLQFLSELDGNNIDHSEDQMNVQNHPHNLPDPDQSSLTPVDLIILKMYAEDLSNGRIRESSQLGTFYKDLVRRHGTSVPKFMNGTRTVSNKEVKRMTLRDFQNFLGNITVLNTNQEIVSRENKLALKEKDKQVVRKGRNRGGKSFVGGASEYVQSMREKPVEYDIGQNGYFETEKEFNSKVYPDETNIDSINPQSSRPRFPGIVIPESQVKENYENGQMSGLARSSLTKDTPVDIVHVPIPFSNLTQVFPMDSNAKEGTSNDNKFGFADYPSEMTYNEHQLRFSTQGHNVAIQNSNLIAAERPNYRPERPVYQPPQPDYQPEYQPPRKDYGPPPRREGPYPGPDYPPNRRGEYQPHPQEYLPEHPVGYQGRPQVPDYKPDDRFSKKPGYVETVFGADGYHPNPQTRAPPPPPPQRYESGMNYPLYRNGRLMAPYPLPTFPPPDLLYYPYDRDVLPLPLYRTPPYLQSDSYPFYQNPYPLPSHARDYRNQYPYSSKGFSPREMLPVPYPTVAPYPAHYDNFLTYESTQRTVDPNFTPEQALYGYNTFQTRTAFTLPSTHHQEPPEEVVHGSEFLPIHLQQRTYENQLHPKESAGSSIFPGYELYPNAEENNFYVEEPSLRKYPWLNELQSQDAWESQFINPQVPTLVNEENPLKESKTNQYLAPDGKKEYENVMLQSQPQMGNGLHDIFGIYDGRQYDQELRDDQDLSNDKSTEDTTDGRQLRKKKSVSSLKTVLVGKKLNDAPLVKEPISKGMSKTLHDKDGNVHVFNACTMGEGLCNKGGDAEQNEDGHVDNSHESLEQQAKRIIKSRVSAQIRYARKMQRVVDSMAHRYVSSFLNAKPYGKYLQMAGMYMITCIRLIQNRYKVPHGELMTYLAQSVQKSFLHPLPGIFRPDTPMPVPESMDYCPYPRDWECDAYTPYRSIDGACNNLHYPIQGRSMLPFRRLLPANYGDGLETMRLSVEGGPLPSARIASLHLFPDQDRRDQLHTLMLMNFGQFLDHDLTHTAITKMSVEDNGVFSKDKMTEVKCGFDGCESGTPDTEACWPIPVPDDDPDFRYNRCIKFVRSEEVPVLSCTFAPREQLNQVTAWLDGSAVYGSTIEEAEKLRDHDTRRGRMLVSSHPHGNVWKPLLPQDPDVELCREVNATVQCFSAGDERVNEQAGLSTIHLMLVREHNRIEENLHLINPHWDGERLYQESRRILSAMFQHIVYNEFLPIVLGPKVMYQYGLTLQKKGYASLYDAKVDPRPANSFATAAFRFGHTLIHESVRRATPDFKYDDSLMLSQLFHRPGVLYDTGSGGVDGLIRGMCESTCQQHDTFFTKQISRSLFTEKPPHGPGMDLLSLNIQRGRDHGIPSYNDFRELCGLKRAYNFDDLRYEIQDRRVRAMLKRVYKSVDDIDLFAGGISERSVEGGLVGPVFACIIGDQFRSVKHGDRFWFENGGPQAFSPEQLQAIRSSMLSKLYCSNGDGIDLIQPWVFFAPKESDFKFANAMFDKLNDVEQSDLWFETLAYTQNYPEDSRQPPQQFQRLLKDDPEILDEMFPRDRRTPVNFRVPCQLLPSVDLSAWREAPYAH